MKNFYYRIIAYLFAGHLFTSLVAINYDYDLIVIGSNLSALHATREAMRFNKRIAIVDHNKRESFDVIYSDIAVKILSRIASVGHLVKEAHAHGLSNDPAGLLKVKELFNYVRKTAFKVHELQLNQMTVNDGAKLISGSATFIDNHTIAVGKETYTADKFLIATGLINKKVPESYGVTHELFHTPASFLNLDELPSSIIIVGGTPIGLEIACALTFLGRKVTLVDRFGILLPKFDYELVGSFMDMLDHYGLKFELNTKVISVEKEGGQVVAVCKRYGGSTKRIKANVLVIARNQIPNIQGLNLDKIGIKYNDSGIVVNQYLQTSIPNIYSCGDVTSCAAKSTRIGDYQASVAGYNIFSPFWQRKKIINYDNASRMIFSWPPLASVGLTEQEAIKIYDNAVIVHRIDYADIPRAIIDHTQDGVAKLICDPHGKLVGAHILGDRAGELVDYITLGKTLKQISDSYLKELHTPPSYFDVFWKITEKIRETGTDNKYQLLEHVVKWVDKIGLYFLGEV